MHINTNSLKIKSFYRNICGLGIILFGIVLVLILRQKGKDEVNLLFNKDTAMYVTESDIVSIGEYLIYAASISQEAMEMYGENVWEEEVTIGDKNSLFFEEYTKRQVCEQIKMTHMLNAVADKYKVSLTEEELQAILSDAKNYNESLKEIDTSEIGIDLALILKVYKENALAEKVYHSILAKVEKTDEMLEGEYEEACYSYFENEYNKICEDISANWSYEKYVNIEGIGLIKFSNIASKEEGEIASNEEGDIASNEEGDTASKEEDNIASNEEDHIAKTTADDGMTFNDIKDFEIIGIE